MQCTLFCYTPLHTILQGSALAVMSRNSVFCNHRDLVLPARYAQLFWEEREPAIGFDPSVFKAELPLPPASEPKVSVFVLGAEKDRTVDQQAFRETAEWYNVQPVIIPELAHDVMLVSPAMAAHMKICSHQVVCKVMNISQMLLQDTRWQDAAEALENWCAEL